MATVLYPTIISQFVFHHQRILEFCQFNFSVTDITKAIENTLIARVQASQCAGPVRRPVILKWLWPMLLHIQKYDTFH